MKTYAMIDISLEAFSLETCEDVAGDGVDSYSKKLLLEYRIG
jgi:hypothetical protein